MGFGRRDAVNHVICILPSLALIFPPSLVLDMPTKYLDRKYSKLLPPKRSVSQCFKAFRSIGCKTNAPISWDKPWISWVSPPMPSLVLLHRHSRREIKDEMPRPAFFEPCQVLRSCKKPYPPPKFNIAPEKWWLEDYFPIGKGTFQVLC